MSTYRSSLGAEVLGAVILEALNALGIYKEFGRNILQDLGITDIQPDQWYSQETLSKFYHTLKERTGPATMFVTGKAVAQALQIPVGQRSIEQVPSSLGQMWRVNHRHITLDVGWKHQKTGDRSAVMTIVSPYPDDFERGILIGVVERFKPADSVGTKVVIDETKPRNDHGGAFTSFLVSW
ncbi:MAG: hypothetical protein GY832_37130 [Chloroflexi bacterium]|nr:hypothetical protein [Chloroflexota bacterium]